MKKKVTSLMFAFIICLCTVFPVLADESGFADEYYRVNDAAYILTPNDKDALNEKLDEISLRQDMDVTVTITDDLDGFDDAQEYADYIYDFCNYGYGADKDGILLLISLENHDWAISTCGYGITVFTDAGIQYIVAQMKDDLSSRDYAAAIDTYASLCDEFITQAKSGSPYDSSNLPREPLGIIYVPISIAIGIILALAVVGGMKGKLKTVRSQAAANSYMKDGSLSITESSDLFLYRTETRTERKKDSGSGSSTHASSSGTTHGGSSGKF